MSALHAKAIEVRLVAELRLLPAGAKPNLRAIRLAIAAELGSCSPAELAAAVQSLRFAGKLSFDRLELSESMKASGASACAPAAEGPEDGGGIAPTPSSGPDDDGPSSSPASSAELYRLMMAKGARLGLSQSRVSIEAFGNEMQMSSMKRRPIALSRRTLARARAWLAGPDDDDGPDDEVPGGVNDVERQPAARRKTPGGWTKQSNLAGSRPIPAPEHEPEVARQVREEVNASVERRRLARSTATVRQPLELRKFGIADMGAGEAVASLLVETPHDLLIAIDRKHSGMWKRVILAARAAGTRPAEALYAALERGLDQLEAGLPAQANAA